MMTPLYPIMLFIKRLIVTLARCISIQCHTKQMLSIRGQITKVNSTIQQYLYLCHKYCLQEVQLSEIDNITFEHKLAISSQKLLLILIISAAWRLMLMKPWPCFESNSSLKFLGKQKPFILNKNKGFYGDKNTSLILK